MMNGGGAGGGDGTYPEGAMGGYSGYYENGGGSHWQMGDDIEKNPGFGQGYGPGFGPGYGPGMGPGSGNGS